MARPGLRRRSIVAQDARTLIADADANGDGGEGGSAFCTCGRAHDARARARVLSVVK